ncbi:hypothetical protein BDA99DRAFT_541749 [Phascolomyces articulosus]|uniref:Transmembrane protein n=1 Tax=Phascolomyces articulosus TaxID=60185 RepID=A0AAD5K0P8_9FUNG|nr:hypothetical protein BDA99DRAFT_541749 [Phascolomyces articulosus]
MFMMMHEDYQSKGTMEYDNDILAISFSNCHNNSKTSPFYSTTARYGNLNNHNRHHNQESQTEISCSKGVCLICGSKLHATRQVISILLSFHKFRLIVIHVVVGLIGFVPMKKDKELYPF